METDVLKQIDSRLRLRAPLLADQLLEAIESGDASPAAVLSGIKELKLLITQLLGDTEQPPVEILVKLEDKPENKSLSN